MRDRSIIITSGILKGLSLELPKQCTTRPSKAILRESVLNSLQDILSELIFIEVFAGSGGVGIAALSRGARGAVFIEKDQEAFEILRGNVHKVLQRANLTARCFHGDSFQLMSDVLRGLDSKIALFFDPPFPKEGENLYLRLIEIVRKLDLKNCEAMIFEASSMALKEGTFPRRIQDFSIIKTKQFGASSLIYYRKEGFND